MLGDPSQTIFSLWKCSATPRRPFFRCRNAPRPLAGRFFAVGMLRDPSPAIFSLWKCSATPRGPFFRCRNASRPLAEGYLYMKMLGKTKDSSVSGQIKDLSSGIEPDSVARHKTFQTSVGRKVVSSSALQFFF